jgi:predicted RNase H-like HicB family nuclease
MHVSETSPKQGAPRAAEQILRLQFTVIIEKDGHAFHAFCPALKGLHVDGENEKEALRNAAEAVHVYVKSLVSHGEPLPIGPHCRVEEEEQIPVVPPGALLRYLEIQWPSLSMSGIS